MLIIGSSKAANEGVQAAPRLPQRTGAGSRWVWEAEEWAVLVVDLGFAELVEIPEELKYVSSAAHRERQRRPVVPEVLAEGVPVPPLLVFVAAGSGGGCGYC